MCMSLYFQSRSDHGHQAGCVFQLAHGTYHRQLSTSSPCAEFCHSPHSHNNTHVALEAIEMHNSFLDGGKVHRESIKITTLSEPFLSVKGTVHFYSCTRGRILHMGRLEMLDETSR
jgi:hypothetical protein